MRKRRNAETRKRGKSRIESRWCENPSHTHLRGNSFPCLARFLSLLPLLPFVATINLSIQGRATQEDIQIVITPLLHKWGAQPINDEIVLPQLTVGDTYEMEGYETGGYIGISGEVLKKAKIVAQTCALYFREEFEVMKGKRIDPIVFSPQMFEGEHAPIQGKAVSKENRPRWLVKAGPSLSWMTRLGRRISKASRLKLTACTTR